MTVAHKNLTGTDLHIIKGADTATVGKVPVANGSGDAPFALLTHTSLQTTGNPFGAQLLHIREVSLTSAVSNGAWYTLRLDTVVTNEITSASLAAFIISLPAGTYYCEAYGPGYLHSVATGNTWQQRLRLRNTTAGSTVLVGLAHSTANTSGTTWQGPSPRAVMRGRFTLAGTTDLQLQIYTANMSILNTHGGDGEAGAYDEILIWKIA